MAPPIQPVFRPSDSRPRHDDAKLAQVGIRKYVSRRLLLYTDIAPELAQPLPELMDRAYEAWEEYFGALPPDRERSDFQMTGYLMAEKQRFVETGLLPEDLPGFLHGRHRGAEFWMNDQQDDYYRRHLLLHEGTHCFMTIVPHPMTRHVWYMEGMAELFGTHTIDAAGHVRFRVMPHDKENFKGLGRLRIIRDEITAGKPRDLNAVLGLRANEFLKNEPYAWSWALCKFLDTHPRYRERFRRVAEHVTAENARSDFRKLFETDWADLRDAWQLFSNDLCEGYDIDRAVIDFQSGQPLNKNGQEVTVEIVADRGWQSSRVDVEAGGKYHVTADGRFVVAQIPKPWESEPQGVSIRYCDGKPLGMLLATIRETVPSAQERTTMLDTIPVGKDHTFTANVTGTIYLRINDFWNELADNSGKVRVVIHRLN